MEHLESKSGRVDDTYFTATDVEPDIITREDGTQFVQFYGGRGRSRSWGAPGCDNYILIDEPDFLFSLTGFYHKHLRPQSPDWKDRTQTVVPTDA